MKVIVFLGGVIFLIFFFMVGGFFGIFFFGIGFLGFLNILKR